MDRVVEIGIHSKSVDDVIATLQQYKGTGATLDVDLEYLAKDTPPNTIISIRIPVKDNGQDP